jgi:chromate transporter
LASLPVVQDSLVIHDQVLNAKQLNEAVVITRGTPGPAGIYVVSVGHFVADVSLSVHWLRELVESLDSAAASVATSVGALLL